MKILEVPYMRSKLHEGRNYGVGFAFLEEEGEGFRPLMPFTACRDYFNDFVYVENTKKKLGSIHGFKHEYCGYLEDKDFIHLGVTAVHYSGGKTWKDYDKCLEYLKSPAKIVEILNYYEDKFGFNSKSTAQVVGDVTVFESSKEWLKCAPLVSLYTLIIRCMLNYVGQRKGPKTFLKHTPIVMDDAMYLKNIANPLKYPELIKELALIGYSYKQENPSSGTVHNFGIHGYLKEMEKKKVIA